MNAIYILWLREVKRYVRSRVQIIFSLVQPTFYLLAFGFGFGPVFEKAGEGSYLQFLAPGVSFVHRCAPCVECEARWRITQHAPLPAVPQPLSAPLPTTATRCGRRSSSKKPSETMPRSAGCSV